MKFDELSNSKGNKENSNIILYWSILLPHLYKQKLNLILTFKKIFFLWLIKKNSFVLTQIINFILNIYVFSIKILE